MTALSSALLKADRDLGSLEECTFANLVKEFGDWIVFDTVGEDRYLYKFETEVEALAYFAGRKNRGAKPAILRVVQVTP